MSWPSFCIRECIDAEFHAVLGALDIVSSTAYPSMEECASLHEGMASVEVEIDGVDATLRLFPLVGGAQQPVTELLLIIGEGDQAPSARRFLVELVRLVERELHAAPGAVLS